MRKIRSEIYAAALIAAVLGGCTGEDGAQGEPGAPGSNGQNGEPGEPGEPGGNGSNGTDGSDGVRRTLSFAPVAAPVTDADKRRVMASPEALVDDQLVALGYTTQARSGDAFGAHVFGRIVDQAGAPILGTDGSPFISPSNDYSSLLQVNNQLFEITHFETQPGAMYISQVAQDGAGKLSMTSTRPVDFSGVHGLWNPCAGSTTPWNTHLGGEEYPQDARQTEGATTVAQVTGSFNVNMLRYFGIDPTTATVAAAKAAFKPYYYGFPVEVAVDPAGATTVTKHYAMGRRALELGYVMPDRRTVYLTDDGTNDSLQMFVATTPGNLTAGKLYAARWFQTSPVGAGNGSADVYWIELGPTATNAEVEALVDGGITFSQIFDTAVPSAGTCAGDFRWVNVDAAAPGECLRLRPGMELAASRLESRRYASYLGATTEFRKIEGLTYDPAGHRLYLAMSELTAGMQAAHATWDLGGPDHLKLAANKCGGVYELVIAPDSIIGSQYVANATKATLEGIWLNNPAAPNPYPAGSPYAGKNECSVNAIANPDNLSFVPGYDVLLVGEDSTSEHQNDAVWAYNVRTKELNRIMTTPYGAETTGVYFYPDLLGRAYIKAQVQHPFGESDQTAVEDPSELRSYTGYLGPFPSMRP